MLVQAAHKILSQLYDFSSSLGQERFTQSVAELSGSSIGQHTRHVLEFFDCLITGYETGMVNYDQRKHDKALEGNLSLCLSRLEEIKKNIASMKEHRFLELQCSYSFEDEKNLSIRTVVERELAYNIEHAVHHMAIMKIAAAVIAPEIKLPSDFGIAASTIKYRESHVHSNISF